MQKLAEISMKYTPIVRLSTIMFFYIFQIVFASKLYAQVENISGTILSSDTNEPLIGVTLRTKNTAVISDINGAFSLENVYPNDTLILSYVGYNSLRIPLAQQNGLRDLDIKMTPSENLLETATVTSGKYDKAIGEITVSMEILKPKLIEDTNTKSLDQVLEKVPGVTIIDGQANIRGGSGYSFGAGSRVLLLLDDIPALTSDSGSPNWDDIPIELTNQIEVLKGASSALFGSSAMNGIINLRTDFAKEAPETKIASFITFYDAPKDKAKHWWAEDRDTIPLDYATYVTHKQKFGNLEFVGSVFLRRNQEWNKGSFANYQRGSIGLRYKANKNWTFGINGNVRQGQSGSFIFWANADSLALVPSQGSSTFSDQTRFIVDPYIQYSDENGNKHKIQGRIYDVDNELTLNQSNASTLYYGEYQYQKRFLQSNLVLTGGLVGSYTIAEAELFSNSRFTSNNLAAYIQADKEFFDKLNVSLGLRYEQNEINAPDSIPINNENMAAGSESEARPVFRLGANYELGKKTFLRASFGQGFRFPTIAEKYISTQVGFNISPNLDLKSESGWSAEIGLKQSITIGEFNGIIDVALFQTEYQNMLEFAFSNVFAIGFQSQNIGNTVIRGVDLSISGGGNLFSKLPINVLLGYTYLEPRFKEFGEFEMRNSTSDRNILKYRFQHTAKIDLATNFDNFNIGIAGFIYSNMEAIDTLFELFIPGLAEYRAANNTPFSYWNIRASFNLFKDVKGSILLNNIFNTEYRLRPAMIEQTRNLSFRLDYSF